MKKFWWIILIVFILLGIQQYIIWNNSRVLSTDDLILQKINKLELKIDSLSNKRDSIKKEINNVDKELENNVKKHEEVVDIIINNNDSSNRVFIDNYIKNYIDRVTTE